MTAATDSTAMRIARGVVEKREAEERRGHLGWSQLGNEDERYLWMNFRWCLPGISDPRILMIFDNGNAVEDLLAGWMRQAGLHLETSDADGNQFRFTRLGDHLSGSMDGAIYSPPERPNDWGVWEAKSANASRFKELTEKGLKAWSPEYWGQGIGYMGEACLPYCLWVVYCKDNSEIYVEVQEAEPMAYQILISKAEEIITATEPTASPYSRSDYRVKFRLPSDHEQEIYFGERLPQHPNCRNCRFSEPLLETEGAQWGCHRHDRIIGTPKHQWRGCDQHQWIPALVPADVLEVSDEGVKFKTPEGHEFVNGPDGFSSSELIALAANDFALLGDEIGMELREKFDARIMTDERVRALGLDPDEAPF